MNPQPHVIPTGPPMSTLRQLRSCTFVPCETSTNSEDLVGEREGHCAVIASTTSRNGAQDLEVLVVFGGYCEGSFDAHAVAAVIPRKELLLTTTTTMVRQDHQNAVGGAVASSSSSAAISHGSNGGHSSSSLSWYTCGTNTACFETDGMTACADVAHRRFLCFGGIAGDSYAPRQSLFEVRWMWSFGDGNTPLAVAVSELEQSGDIPPARWRHMAAMDTSGHRMIVVGGETVVASDRGGKEEGHGGGDVYLLDVFSPDHVWTRFRTSTILSPHGLTPTNRFLGGCGVFRSYVSSDEASTTVSDVLLVVGGCVYRDNEPRSLSDMWTLPLPLHPPPSAAACGKACATWTRVDCASTVAFPPTNGHVMVSLCSAQGEEAVSHGALFAVFGGKDADRGSDDVFGIHLVLRGDVGGERRHTCSAADVAPKASITSLAPPPYVATAAATTSTELLEGGGGGSELDDRYDWRPREAPWPHWRYTACAVPLTTRGGGGAPHHHILMLVGGQCRHPDPVATTYAMILETATHDAQ